MRTPTAILLVTLLCLPIHLAQAQMVYKCVGKGGAVSFQSDPCPATQKTVKTVYAPPEAERPRAASASTPTRSAATNVSGGGYWSPGSETERDRRKRECAIARQSRQDTLDRIGLQRTHDLLRKLDNTVYEACKGL